MRARMLSQDSANQAAPLRVGSLFSGYGGLDLAYLKVSESTLSRWRSAGMGPPFIRMGGIARYRIEAVDAWLAELEHHHAPQE